MVQASEGSLVSLPYLSKGNDAGSVLVNYEVNVYPKTQACTQADEPAGTVPAAWRLQRNVLGFKALATDATERAGSSRAVARTRSAGFDACSGGVPDHGSSDQPSSFAETEAGVRKLALIVLVLTGIWMLIVVVKDRKRAGGQSHNQRL